MNRKGQILIFFVILVPLILTIAAFAIDISFNYYQSNKLHNISRMTINYGLKHINEPTIRSKMIDLIYKNDRDIDSYELTITKNKIHLKLKKTVNSVFGKIINIDFYYISANYTGTIDNSVITIEKG